MNIPTPSSLRRLRRQMDRQRLEAGKLHAQAQAVIARMHSENQCLRVLFGERNGPVWHLSPSGQVVPPAVAAVVLADPDVVSGGDGLLKDGPSQTWRLVETA